MRAHPRAGAAEPLRNWQEAVLSRVIRLSGYSAIVFVGLIFLFLVREGLPALVEVPLADLFSARWYPIEGYFGVLPLITGSLIVTVGAMAVAIPFGIGTAMFISEIAPRWAREVLKPMVELLGGLPSVVLGFLGMLVLSPFLRQALDLPTGLTALAGSLLLAGIALPTIVSIAEDALDAVPKSYREGALALGATRWQTMWGVTLPAARSGVLTAVMLGIGRAIGETMAVMMVTGNAPVLAVRLASIVAPARTMTATIAAEMGEVASGSTHYHVLFFIGMVLFLISLAVNVAASAVVFRQRTRAERVLS
ncbi:MAG: phosphate ABC transporter permease subunit PstC [Chloroflexi bacterium RBG_13_68_17]|jgi:phosphate transport system permease protein|nr:MAG: phosphate ABC transporter permease subunit PstC [Chloroflexi bacterium RBG_13_68_17]